MIKKRFLRSYWGGRDCIKDFLLNTIAGSPLCSFYVRRKIYALYGHKVDIVYSNCTLGEGPGHLVVGKGSYCNHRCFFDLGNDITIGSNCGIAMNVCFINGTHEFGSHSARGGKGYTLPVKIGDGVWIGANAIILPGITVGDGCFIAAGALVTKDCEPDGYYAGIPAKRIRTFNN